MKGKYFLTATLISAVLLTIFFTPPSNQQEDVYNPWIDTNDDGVIDASDLFELSKVYGTSGEAINKTALLLELQDKIDSLNTSLGELEDKVSVLEANRPKIITYRNLTRHGLVNDDVWHDLYVLDNVTISEGASVLAIATMTFDGNHGDLIQLRMRANSTIIGPEFKHRWTDYYDEQILEIHNPWTNLAAGNYTFAVQYRDNSGIDVLVFRFTLMII